MRNNNMRLPLIVIITLAFIFLTGCQAEYNIHIKHNGYIEDELVVVESNDLLSQKYSNYKQAPKSLVKQYEGIDELKKISFKEVYLNNQSGVSSKRNYTYKEFSDSYIGKMMFSSIDFFDNEDGYSFSMYDFDYIDQDYDPDVESIKQVNITIKSDYYVLDNNADTVDIKRNIYTWKVGNDFIQKNGFIELKLSHKKRYDVIISNFINDNLIYFLVFGTFFLVATILGIRLFIKHKLTNRI